MRVRQRNQPLILLRWNVVIRSFLCRNWLSENILVVAEARKGSALDIPEPSVDPENSYISTGALPGSDFAARLVTEAHLRFRSIVAEQNSQV